MKSYYSPRRDFEINIVDLIWNLLMQWKAVLIVCMAMAFLITGAKYTKDLKAYEASIAEKAAAEAEASVPLEERISAIMGSLSPEDASTVQYLLEVQDQISIQKYYLSNSILLNVDPTNQRSISFDYYLQKGSVSDIQTLIDAYSNYLRKDSFVKSLREVISPDADLHFIYELINITNSTIVDDTVGSTVLSIDIVVPEDTDAKSVITTVDSGVNSISKELSSVLGEHRIKRILAEDHHLYSQVSADRRTNISYAINNLTNNLNNAKNNLSEEQKKVLESITALKSAEEVADAPVSSQAAVNKPTLSKKFFVLGILLGIFLYCGIYLIIVILNKTVFSSSGALNCTGTRLLGELYVFSGNNGPKGIFSSKAVIKNKYKDKLDIDNQLEQAAASIDAICTHHNTDKPSFLLCGIPESFRQVLDSLVAKCNSGGRNIKINIIDTDNYDEKSLSNVSNAVYVLSNKTAFSKVFDISDLCRDYDINPLGTIYIEEI